VSLVNLKNLDVSWNFLPDVDFVTALVKLETFDCNCNRFIKPMPDMTGLVELRTLNFSETSSSVFPKLGASNKKLILITVENTGIEEIPDFIGDIENLSMLCVGDNRPMKKCTPRLNKLKELRLLNLSGGSLTALPSEWRKEFAICHKQYIYNSF